MWNYYRDEADAEDLDLVMLMYNLIENSSNCSETTGSLWFYSINEATNFDTDIGKKHLGPILDSKLNFQEHLKNILKKVNKTIGLL